MNPSQATSSPAPARDETELERLRLQAITRQKLAKARHEVRWMNFEVEAMRGAS